MPNLDAPLTQEEKEEIIIKHHELVDSLNQMLPQDQQLKYNRNLPLQLEDKKEVKYYRTVMAANAQTERKKAIYQELMERLGPVPSDKLSLARSFVYGLKTEDTAEARAYNEQLYRTYQTNPDKLVYQRFKPILDFNPQVLVDVLGDKQKMAEFYLNNQRLCEDAFVFSSTLADTRANVRPELRQAVSSMAKIVETISYPKMVSNKDGNMEYFTFPKDMTDIQAAIILNEHPGDVDQNTREHLLVRINASGTNNNPLEFYNNLRNQGYELNAGFFLQHRAFTTNDRNERVELPLEDAINQVRSGNQNIEFERRSQAEMEEMRKINKTYEREYLKVWQDKFSRAFDGRPFNYAQIKDHHKGNIFERIGFRTSREYNTFIDALKDFNDPNSPHYLNKERLRNAANGYIDHKAEQGISLNRMDRTGRDRIMLASSVIKALDQMEDRVAVNAEIENRLRENDYHPIIEIQPAINNQAEVQENFFDNNQINMEDNQVQMSNEINVE